MFNPTALAQRLVEARGKVRAEDWAPKLGVPLDILYRIETGDEAPSLDYLYRVHLATGIDLTWLITGHGPKLSSSIMGAAARAENPPSPGPDVRGFSDLSLAQLAAGLIADTTLPKLDREIIGDLIITAVADPGQRETIILIHRFLKFAKLHRPE